MASVIGGRFGIAIVLTATALTMASPAGAQQPVGPYDGKNPFRCELQDVGTGTDFPDPDADPFCVKFDKTSQNVTDFGIVDFLANEPARVAAAGPKCFYYQRDHWTGSVVQGQTPELWNWVGGYYFDKAKGVGGVSVRNYRIGGAPQDFTPFAPPEYQPYFDATGGGGVQFLLESGPDPGCRALIDTPQERSRIYRGTSHERRCVPPGGRLRGTQVGKARLGMKRSALRKKLGHPHKRRRGVDRWCLIGNASLRAVYKPPQQRRGSATPHSGGARVALLRTSSRGHSLRRIAPGDPARKAEARFGKPGGRAGNTRVIDGGGTAKRHAYVGVRGGRVRWLAIADPSRLGPARAIRALRRAR